MGMAGGVVLGALLAAALATPAAMAMLAIQILRMLMVSSLWK